MRLKIQHDVSDRLYLWLVEFTGARRAKRLVFVRAETLGFTVKGEIEKMEVRMEPNQQSGVEVQAFDRHGLPARVENPVWTSSDESVATIEVAPENPLQAIVKTGDRRPEPGVPLTATITCVADADLDVDEIRNLVAVGTVIVVEPEATVFEMVFQPASDIPPTEPPPTEPAPVEEPPVE